MQVEEIALLSTALIRWDGSRIVYPNAKMSTDMLINITRSGNKGDTMRVRPPILADARSMDMLNS